MSNVPLPGNRRRWCRIPVSHGLTGCDQLDNLIGGLTTANRVDPGVVAHQRPGIMTEPLSHFGDAGPGIEKAGGEKVPDLVRADRPDPGRDSEPIESPGHIVRPQRLTTTAGNMYLDTSSVFDCGLASIKA